MREQETWKQLKLCIDHPLFKYTDLKSQIFTPYEDQSDCLQFGLYRFQAVDQ